MENKNSVKPIVAFAVLVLCFLVGFYIFAWTGPTAAPPSANTSAPINTGSEVQTKQGNLTIGTATIKGDGSISTNLNSDKVDDLHAADLLAQTGGRMQVWKIKNTSASYSADLGGRKGANEKCQAEFGANSVMFGTNILNCYIAGNCLLKFEVASDAWADVNSLFPTFTTNQNVEVATSSRASCCSGNALKGTCSGWTSKPGYDCGGYCGNAGNEFFGYTITYAGMFSFIHCSEQARVACAIPE